MPLDNATSIEAQLIAAVDKAGKAEDAARRIKEAKEAGESPELPPAIAEVFQSKGF